MDYEIELHKLYDVANNSDFYNLCRSTSTSFCGGVGKNNVRYGKTHTEASRQKIREGNLGKIVSKETREKMTGENNPNFGKRPSKETRQKIREANLGKIVSKETRQKLREANSGEKIVILVNPEQKKPKKKLAKLNLNQYINMI